MKNLKCLLAASIFFGIIAFSASALSVGVQVIQDDSSQDSIRASSYLVENTILDTFFDYGYVVTNTPIAVKKSENAEIIENKALDEAFEGQIDMLVFVEIKYKVTGSTNPDALLLSNMESLTWKIVDVVTRRVVATSVYTVGTVSSANNSSNGIKKLVQNSVDAIYQVLRNSR